MKVRDLIKTVRPFHDSSRITWAAFEKDGWKHVKTRGSHRQYKHPSKPGRVTIPGHMNDDLHPGTLKSILKQAGFREKP